MNGIGHPKKCLSSFTHDPHVIRHLYDFLSSVEHKIRYCDDMRGGIILILGGYFLFIYEVCFIPYKQTDLWMRKCHYLLNFFEF